MDSEAFAVLCLLGSLATGLGVVLAFGGPRVRRGMGRVFETIFRMRCFPFVRDPFKPMREYDASQERRAQDLLGRISAVTRRLQRRRVVSAAEASRYVRLAQEAVERVWGLEQDARELNKSATSEADAANIETVALQTVDGLEELYAGLSRLLAMAAGGGNVLSESLQAAQFELSATLAAHTVLSDGAPAAAHEESDRRPVIGLETQ